MRATRFSVFLCIYTLRQICHAPAASNSSAEMSVPIEVERLKCALSLDKLHTSTTDLPLDALKCCSLASQRRESVRSHFRPGETLCFDYRGALARWLAAAILNSAQIVIDKFWLMACVTRGESESHLHFAEAWALAPSSFIRICVKNSKLILSHDLMKQYFISKSICLALFSFARA